MAVSSIKYKSILYIDADSDDCQLVQDALRELDIAIEVAFAYDASFIEREISKLRTAPDLVIFAINRPSENDITHLKECQSNSKLAGIPFCVFSSTKIREIVDQTYSLGVTSFFIKPGDFKILKGLLREMISYDWSKKHQLARKVFIVTEKITIDGDLTCFLIDDDREDRDIFLNAIKELYPDVACHTAFDGEDALSQLSKSKLIPDVIFLDLNMPRMNGIDCLRIMRSIRDLDQSKIVIFTVSTDPEDIRTTNALGANRFITKPANVDSMVDVLTGVLENS